MFSGINELAVTIDTASRAITGKDRRVIGEMIPGSYFTLIDKLRDQTKKKYSRNKMPIMYRDEFEALLKENAKFNGDIEDPDDLEVATKFLHDRGIVHYRCSPWVFENKGTPSGYMGPSKG